MLLVGPPMFRGVLVRPTLFPGTDQTPAFGSNEVLHWVGEVSRSVSGPNNVGRPTMFRGMDVGHHKISLKACFFPTYPEFQKKKKPGG